MKTYFDARPDEDGLAGCLLLGKSSKNSAAEQLIEYLEGLHQQRPENTAFRYFLAEKYAGAKTTRRPSGSTAASLRTPDFNRLSPPA